MMNNVEAIKIIIMEAFSRYKPLFEFDEDDFRLLKEMDYKDSIDDLFELVNSNDFKAIKNIMLKEEFYNYLKNNDYLQIQIDFVDKLNNINL